MPSATGASIAGVLVGVSDTYVVKERVHPVRCAELDPISVTAVVDDRVRAAYRFGDFFRQSDEAGLHKGFRGNLRGCALSCQLKEFERKSAARVYIPGSHLVDICALRQVDRRREASRIV